MSLIDKVLGAVTPPESEEDRREATQKARNLASGDDWLSMALDHHDEIRSAFETCRSAAPSERTNAMKRLASVLNSHSFAEEVVLYPALAKSGDKSHAGMAYTEQSTAKMQMAELERINPADAAWDDKLEHIRGAVLHHIFEEESTWFPEVKSQYEDQFFLTLRFREEYRRFDQGDALGADDRSFAPRSEPPASLE